jgi:L-rhamnose-H+ transport protein
MGDLGNVIGWPILLGLGLIISNGWALATGEWKGAWRPLKTMGVAVAIIIVGCVVLGYAKRPEPTSVPETTTVRLSASQIPTSPEIEPNADWRMLKVGQTQLNEE